MHRDNEKEFHSVSTPPFEIIQSVEHTCKKREIAEIYLRKFFWIFRKILG